VRRYQRGQPTTIQSDINATIIARAPLLGSAALRVSSIHRRFSKRINKAEWAC
jgi:hypothetical protein